MCIRYRRHIERGALRMKCGVWQNSWWKITSESSGENLHPMKSHWICSVSYTHLLCLLSVSKAYGDPGDFGWTAPRSGGFDCFSRSIDFEPCFLEWKPGFLLSSGHILDRCSSVRFLSFCSAKMEAQSDLCHGGGWYFRARRVLLFVDLIKIFPVGKWSAQGKYLPLQRLSSHQEDRQESVPLCRRSEKWKALWNRQGQPIGREKHRPACDRWRCRT